MSTASFSAKDIKRQTHTIDASDKVLGRLSVEAAKFLMGKYKSEFVPYLDMGDFVEVSNFSKIKVTGKKLKQKEYKRHSGYPGGLKSESLEKLLQRNPKKVLEHAVSGMLPKNRLGQKMIRRLKVYMGEKNG